MMLMLRSIAPAIDLKKQQGKNTFQVFFVLFTWPVSPSGIYGTTCAANDNSKKTFNEYESDVVFIVTFL